ncbi:PQQ-binding-like beta-propeller repeat protein [Rhizomicrobium electricum]|jgi:outer membrane protein assembly factor BamB|uniref:Outer membrane protein assembly factor BamB n=1 Tax=Rhizomicrobium electricum TaxID=480070 RepID=A0ABN1ED11_9PROT|nr:PQQ-binding-like beta-propeller repeat protein [Rhizomicrobium electricum]NIJ48254.1 outer membrane protein assembly factor BamB [Rhizomicrobium electricum]
MITRRFAPFALLAAVAILAGGCGITDTMGKWFSSPHKSKIRGERISIMATDDSLKPDPTLKDVPVVLPAPYVNTEWAQPGGVASNAMHHLKASGPLQQIWAADAGAGSGSKSRLTASPIVAAGKVYVLDARARVFAFNAQNGEEEWHVSVAPGGKQDLVNMMTLGVFGDDTRTDSTKGAGGGIAYDNGKLYATTGFGDVVTLDAKTGKELWRKSFGAPIANAPVINGGRLFVATIDNHMHAIAASNGRELWDHQGITENAGIMVSTSAAVAGEFVLAPYSSGEVYAIRVQNGRPAWNDMITRSKGITALSEIDDIAGKPVVDRDLVFAISHSGVMAAIQLDKGDRQWQRDIGGIQTPWVAGDYVFVITLQNQLMCLTRKEGRVKWIHQLPRWTDPEDTSSDPIVWSGPVLASDRLIVLSSDGYAEAVSPYTGKLMARMEIPDGAYIAPVVANETIYILTNNADLVALK